jgi:hypothetical protein
MEWEPEALAEWEKQFGTEAEIEANKAKIEQEGLTAMVHLELGPWHNGDRLWMLELGPVEGLWTHMRKPEALQALLDEGPYHISIAFKSDIESEAQNNTLNGLWDDYREPFEYTFYVKKLGFWNVGRHNAR